MTRRLWARHEIETRLVSYHAQSPAARHDELLAHLAGGAHLALVTDAGTPLVSDPGGELVAAWAGRGGQVVPIPGASATLAALVASGLPAARFAFEGFLPRRGKERRQRLARICQDERATVVFEAPGRAAATLSDLAAACDARPPRVVVARADQAARGDVARHAGRACRARGRHSAARRGHDRGGRPGRGRRAATVDGHGAGSARGGPARGSGDEPLICRARGRAAHGSRAA